MRTTLASAAVLTVLLAATSIAGPQRAVTLEVFGAVW